MLIFPMKTNIHRTEKRQKNSYERRYWEKGACWVFTILKMWESWSVVFLKLDSHTHTCRKFYTSSNWRMKSQKEEREIGREREWEVHNYMFSMCLLLDTDHWENWLANSTRESAECYVFDFWFFLFDYFFRFALRIYLSATQW